MPEWYTNALANRQDPSASIGFAQDFLAAAPGERAQVMKAWDPRLAWALPNPWRLACQAEAPGAPLERIRTVLLFQALGIGGVDARDSIVGFAIAHNSCKLAGIDPRSVFEEVAAAVGGPAAQALRAFANRDAADQSMEAFLLKAVPDPGGGYELRADW